MFDFSRLDQYRENNRIEAKRALGGLPQSIWETYSAFANTLGGIILLGVEEYNDHSLHAVDLSDPDRLIMDFWDIINNSEKVSVNILTDKHVQKQEADGNHIIMITVPKAERGDKPVYIEANPFTGSYRRNLEGDYRCTKEEIQSMLRDSSIRAQDMLILENMGLDVFDYDSLHRYRIRMKNYRPGHVWEELGDEEFLYRLGAAGRSEDGKLHPTAGGLLMFGHEYEIVKEFPYYFLDYQEKMDNERWTDRIVSTSGDWSGNVYDFYFRVYNKLTQGVKVPFKLEGGNRIDDTSVHKALREALANCIINADYYGRQGLVIVKDQNGILFSNPGNFRIDIEVAKSGGVSDPRNGALIKMFNLVDIGERAGSGIPSIFSIWRKQGWPAPKITETFEPERITVRLTMTDDKPTIKTDDKPTIKADDKLMTDAVGTISGTGAQKAAIVRYLAENTTGKSSDFCELLSLRSTRVKELLAQLISSGVIIAEGANRNRIYRLKDKID